jgi:hypothetical protein
MAVALANLDADGHARAGSYAMGTLREIVFDREKPAALALGASEARTEGGYTVLRDPESNQFCLVDER